LKCPYCGNSEDRVIDSRPIEESSVIRRRRECSACKKRFTTYERPEEVSLLVVKNDDSREVFDRRKLQQGIINACVKRSVSMDTIEKIVDDIENELKDYIIEVPSRVIGERVLEKLKRLDEVAYVRFASIYRRFENVDTFMAELKKLKRSFKNGG